MTAELPIRRRRMLQLAAAATGAVATGLATSARAQTIADLDRLFAAPTFADAIAALGSVPETSEQITVDLPQVADNGALVPVTVSSQLPGTREIVIVVDGNPQPVAASFTIPEGTQPFVATRIRMAQSCTVCVAVRTDTGLYAATRQIQVVVGGCG